MASSIRDWAGLPEHILDSIVAKFGLLSDYFTFPAVCSRWRNLYPRSNFFDILKVSRIEVPMLMIKTRENDDDQRVLYNVLNGVSHNIQLPLPYKHRFVGSSHGWLFCLEKNMNITLLDPFTKDCIALPAFKDPSQLIKREREWSNDTFDYYIHKAILTFDPRTSPNNYEVVVIYKSISKLAYYKSGDHDWRFIDLVPEKLYISKDIICYKGCIYSITARCELLQIDFHNGTAKIIVPRNMEDETDAFYLVESRDAELLLAKRVWDVQEDHNGKDFETTSKMGVFKLKHSSNEEFAAWDKISDIGEQALFVGSTSVSISVSTLECSKFYRNSIYYTAQAYLRNPHYYDYVDCGIFNLEDERFHSHQIVSPLEKKNVQPPVWFVPNL